MAASAALYSAPFRRVALPTGVGSVARWSHPGDHREAQLLGISAATPGTPSGWVGLDTFNNVTFDYNLADQAVPGEVGAVGALEHEISEVFGRVADLSQVPGAGNSELILDCTDSRP